MKTIKKYRQVAFGAKRNPLSSGSRSTTKLNSAVDKHVLGVFILEPLKLSLCLLMVLTRNLKLRLQNRYLRLKVRILSFKLSCLRLARRELFPEERDD